MNVKFLKSDSKAPEDNNLVGLSFIFLILICGINIFQIAFLPFTNLAEGMGYDGIWYFKPANEFCPKTDNYHLFRQMPSTLVFFIKKVIYKPYDYFNTAKAFQIYNLICNLFAVYFTYKICKKLNLGTFKSVMFFGFVFFNFHILKDEVYNPVMTDTTVHLLGLMLLYFYLYKIYPAYFLTSLGFLFTFPIGGLLAQIFYLLNCSKQIKSEIFIQKKWFNNLFAGISVFFLFATSYIVYGLKRITVLTFPDDINIYIFPFTIVLTSFAIYKIFTLHEGLFQNLFVRVREIKSVFSPVFLIFIISLLAYLMLPSFNKMPAQGFTGNFTLSPPLYLTLKPLIGLFDNVLFLGPVIVLFLFLLPSQLKKYQKDDSFQYFSLVFCFFLLKPEARHSLFFLPLVSVAVVQALPDSFFQPKKVIPFLVICLLFSKFWYPCHWAIFPPGYEIFTSKVNHAIFQEFPIQHYFMFQGPMISHQNYLIWLLVMVPLVWYCYRIVHPKKEGINIGKIAKTRSISRP